MDFHILLGTMKAGLALQILALISLFVPPFVSTILPWYVNDCNSSRNVDVDVIIVLPYHI